MDLLAAPFSSFSSSFLQSIGNPNSTPNPYSIPCLALPCLWYVGVVGVLTIPGCLSPESRVDRPDAIVLIKPTREGLMLSRSTMVELHI